ncbi:UNVERIFIED_CONTAM: hypothetical protein GTU68_007823, partial [Idotea baltica]|nr:hypothetical protein [Idotea baltica]
MWGALGSICRSSHLFRRSASRRFRLWDLRRCVWQTEIHSDRHCVYVHIGCHNCFGSKLVLFSCDEIYKCDVFFRALSNCFYFRNGVRGSEASRDVRRDRRVLLRAR